MATYPAHLALAEIQEAIENALEWVGTMTAAELEADSMRYHAVVRCLEIVSEGSRRLPDDLKARHDLKWINIADAGNTYRHAYHRVSSGIVWSTVINSLPPLLAVVRKELEDQ